MVWPNVEYQNLIDLEKINNTLHQEKMKDKITLSPEMAQAEVQKWIEAKRPNKKTLEKANEEIIPQLEEAFLDGFLSLDENNRIVQKLQYPIKNSAGETTVTSLTYKLRLTQGEINRLSEGTGGNPNLTLLAYVCAAASQSKNIINALDSEDFKLASNIALFFM